MQNAALQDADFEPAQSQKAGGAFRTISEVAEDLGVQQHVLRFWETKFSQIRPMKRGGGRRYYRPEDVALLRHIHTLLYSEGYTIKGAQKLLKGQSKGSIAAEAAASAQVKAVNASPITAAAANKPVAQLEVAAPVADAGETMSPLLTEALTAMLNDLKELRSLVGK